MGAAELIDALRREGEEKVRVIRRQAEEEAERLRDAAAARLDKLREDYRKDQTAAIAAMERGILAEAERKARQITLLAEMELAERLLDLARRLLPILRTGDYACTFSFLAAELPPSAWETVRVNPADAEMAASAFAGAEVVPDENITGGMDVQTEGGRVRVVNTLNKRLERGWPGLVAELMGSLQGKTGHDGTIAKK